MKYFVAHETTLKTRSHLTQVSGLKYVLNVKDLSVQTVSPYTGEWIEILLKALDKVVMLLSHLTQVSGLKYDLD